MNQTQRDFLIKHITASHDKHTKELRARKPERPSLNNYLIAAILSDQFEFQPEQSIRAYIRNKVLSLGPSDALIKHDRYHDDDEDGKLLTVAANKLLVLPADYLEAMEKYEATLTEWEAEVEKADAIKETLILKIQIGSNEVLKRLIEQADNLADLQLVNNRLLLTS
jgi:hypothetical protein